MKTIWPSILLLSALTLLSGCGLKRQYVHIASPSALVNPPQGQPVVISEVVDARAPALSAYLNAGELSRNVGGMAHGGNGIVVDLSGGTVAETMRAVVTQALRASGYRVGADMPDAPRVSIRITQFQVDAPVQIWRAAFYNARMLADISAQVTVTSSTGTRTFTVSGHGYNVYQRVVAENWQIALNKAVADFGHNLQGQMAQ